MRSALFVLALAGWVLPAHAEIITVEQKAVTEWKAVYGRVEPRSSVPARARIGGTLVALTVAEGDMVTAGQPVGEVRDDKIAFQISAIEAQLKGLAAQRENAEAELARGQELVRRGVSTAQRLDQLRTAVDVIRNQIAATEAQRQVVEQQAAEGEITAPADGKVLTVPATRGAVIMPGEAVAMIGGGGFFLRLAIPERHAGSLREGAEIEIETGPESAKGRLAKLYPEISNGRVIADVEVDDLPTAFVDARILVRVPIGERMALMVPRAALSTRSGIDFVTVRGEAGPVERSVLAGEPHGEMVEIVSGLAAGEQVIAP